MNTRFLIPLLSALILSSLGSARAADTLSLAGEWKLALDPNDLGLKSGPSTWNFPDTITLPGTTAAQGKGPAHEIALNLEKPAMQHLHQRHPHVGPAWFQRSVVIPADWKGKDIILTLERVLWESRVWIDQKPVGKPQLSLSTPHRHDLTSVLTPGQTHELTLRIDNRQMVDIGSMGHAYTNETQTIWNGVIGKLQLEALPKVRTSHVAVRTQPDRRGITLDLELHNGTPRTVEGTLTVRVMEEDIRCAPAETTVPLRLPPGLTKHPLTMTRLSDRFAPWSELRPAQHHLSISLRAGDTNHQHLQKIGLRTFVKDGRDLRINGNKTFLRGNLECAIFPQTGHPDASGAQWEKIMTVSKAHGLNHLRFHSWCPPRAAFRAADRHGIYLQVELPNWTFKMGQNPSVDAFFRSEGERIFREFGNHPSFVMFSLGNELKGNLQSMDALLAHFRTLAPDLLFTSTSYAFSPRGLLPGPQDDFFISQKTQSGWVRGQGFLNVNFPSTNTDYAEGLECLSIPLVTHEVGQYVVYPNLAEEKKYASTPLRPTALEAIRADLTAKGLVDDAARFTRDSGKLAALLYKEDIERALRTKNLAGIQLLQLQDFPGQSTATVGLLDAFWDSKGLISPEEFRSFSAPVVPLARMDKFVWENTERFAAGLELANFGLAPLRGATFTARLVTNDGREVATQEFPARDFPLGNGLPIGTFEADLSGITAATKLTLEVSSADPAARNTWPVWVYPGGIQEVEDHSVETHRGVTKECLDALAAGRTVLLLPPAGAVKKALPARFIPVFWSPLHFPNQPGTLGATIDTAHPLWAHFPTDTHTNWQWWELTAKSVAIDFTGLDRTIATPFRFVDKYNRNALPVAIFEAMVGPGKLLCCTLDVESDPDQRIVARALKHALAARAASPDFDPAGSLTPEQLAALIGETNLIARAGNAHPSHPASNAIDGKPDTFWHTDWTTGASLPTALDLDFMKPRPLTGLRYLPRQDYVNGRIRTCRFEVSADGQRWIQWGRPATFPNDRKLREVRFDKPVTARYLRVVVTADHGGKNFGGAAELEPLFADPGDVRDLGIIPGFND